MKTTRESRTRQRREWHERNKDQDNESSKSWRQRNPGYMKKWREANPGRSAALIRKYQAAKLQRTPKWLTAEHLREIEEFYILAKELQWLSEEPLEVDHIVPLQGKNVSGLHVPWNLQIIPESENNSKSNKF